MKRNLLIALLLGWLALPLNLQAEEPITLHHFKKIGGDFSLTDFNGKPVSLNDYRDKIVLLYFGYITCPDVCPTTLTDLMAVFDQLGDQSQKVQVLFVTVDPQRDTAKIMKDYLAFFHKDFIGLHGNKDEIEAVAEKYRVSYERRDLGSKAGYLIDHSAFVYLIDQSGELRYLFPFGIAPEKIVEGVNILMN